MTTVYVANPTKQIQSIHIRFKGHGAALQANIPPGNQVKLFGKDFSADEMTEVLGYASRYGWKQYNDVDRGGAGLATIIYSQDKPVPVSKTILTSENNTQRLVEKGKETRDLLAVAMSNTLENQVAESGLPARLAQMEMTVVEEDTKGQGHGLDQIAEARRVTRREDETSRSKPKRRGR